MLIISLLELSNGLQIDVTMPPSFRPRYTFDSVIGARQAKTSMSGGYYTCFLSNLTAENKNFLMMIDTGSTDTIFPSSTVNNYQGPSINPVIPPGSSLKSSTYGDGSWWRGYIVRTNVGLAGKNVNALAPIAVMVNQSTSPVFASGRPANGLMGLGFSALSSASSTPFSVMDAWFDQKVIPKNEIAFHGCPYSRESQSWIDFGNETPYVGCGNQSVTVNMPTKTYYNLDLQRILVGGNSLPFPTTFQSGSGSSRKYSILDSCTSLILLPLSTVNAFRTALRESGAFSQTFQSNLYFDQWIDGEILFSNLHLHIDYSLLPNITFEIATGRNDYNSTQLVLGPRQYIQIDTSGFCITH
jgi:hypothetical protein